MDRRLDSQLTRLVERLTTSSAAEIARSVALGVGDTVPVTIRFDGAPEAIDSALVQFGIASANRHVGVVEAYVPVSLLEQVASLSTVTHVGLIVPPVMEAISQGASVHNATTWQGGGYTGAGVKVGVIDIGFQGLVSLLGTELPASVTARCYVGVGTYFSTPSTCDAYTPHGTAVAEALVDVAPEVQLYIANPTSPLDLRNTVQWMTSLGVKVINHSVGWTWTGPGDGTSPYSDAPVYTVDSAVSDGAMWANAAGNNARATWTGPFVDSDGDGLLDFVGAVEFNGVTLQAGRTFIAQARWEDTWTASARDLDLYLLDSALNIVAWSVNTQFGTSGQTPYEVFSFTPGLSGTYYLVIDRFSGALPAWVQVQAFSQDTLQYHTLTRSISNPAESANPGLLAVGAAPWYDTSAIEPFSSLGPTSDGRVKPDVVGADRGDSTSYGAGAFTGTSQASPHVAGLAALVLQNFPNTPPTQVAAYLRSTATPRSPADTWGAGFAQVPVFPPSITLSAFLSDTTFPAPLGQAITWRAFAVGAGDPFEYQFWVYQEGVGWSIGQAYSPSNTFAWTPMAPGTYSLQVWARSVGSTADYEDWRASGSFVITGPAPLTVTALTANVSFPASWGNTITWSATATGGTQPLQYKFWRLKQGAGWTMVQDYSTASTYTWTPGTSDGGTYLLQVWVRSAGSSADYEGWLSFGYFTIIGLPPVSVLNFTANVSFPSAAFVPITWTAQASGGIQPLQYKFWRLKEGVGWTMVQDYGTSNTYTWTPTGADAGTYVLQVWVRSSGSAAPYEAWSGTDAFDITSPAPVRITGLASDVTLPTVVGTPITWSASATGGSAPIQFKFWLLDVSTGLWTILQDYSPLASVTWTPTGAGSYFVQVWARSTNSVESYEDWRGTGELSILPSTVPVVVSLTANVAFPAMVSNAITWTAVAAGGTAPLEYKFWRLRQGIGWTMVQDYGSSPSFTWTPAPGEEGTYLLQVWVRSAGSTAPFDAWRGTDYFGVVPSTVLRLIGQPGNFVGGSTETILTSSDVTFTPSRNFDNGVSFSATNFTGGQSIFWYLDFAAAGNAELALGSHENATRFPFQEITEPGLSVSGNGAGCNELSGRFVVLEAQYDVGGAVERFAADFEQHCEGLAAALFGSIRYNSTVPLVTVQSLVVTGTLPGRIGTPLAWTATGGSGREYQFWRYSQAARNWFLAQAYSTNPVLIWTPQAGDEGSWAIEVLERPVGSGAAYENWRSSGALSITP